MAAHWTEKWLGRQWVPGRYDCADFVVEVLREEFGRTLEFPPHAAASTGRDRQIDEMRGDYAIRTIAPTDGDGALMREAGGRRRRRYHIGLVAIHAGTMLVLHCSRDFGAVLCRTGDLPAHGLDLEGFYKWT